MTDHKLGHLTFGPTTNATTAARRLSALNPLSDVDAAMSALERGRAVAARKAVETQQTQTVINQMRTDSRARRMKGA